LEIRQERGLLLGFVGNKTGKRTLPGPSWTQDREDNSSWDTPHDLTGHTGRTLKDLRVPVKEQKKRSLPDLRVSEFW
jgi:hypothetical protein